VLLTRNDARLNLVYPKWNFVSDVQRSFVLILLTIHLCEPFNEPGTNIIIGLTEPE